MTSAAIPSGQERDLSGKRVLIVSYHCYPSLAIGARRVAELARSLRDAGATVSILAARADRESGIDHSLTPSLSGIEIARSWKGIDLLDPTYKWAKKLWSRAASSSTTRVAPHPRPENASTRRSTARRLRDAYIALHCTLDRRKQWALLALLRSAWMRLRSGKFDAVIASAPPSAGCIVAYLHCRLFGSPFFMDLRDPWLLEAEIGTFRTKLESPLERSCLAAARRVICASPGISRDLAKRRPEFADKLEVVYNGYDRTISAPPASARRTLTMLFAGALYAGRDPFPFLRALRELASKVGVERGRIQVQFAGACDTFGNESLREWVDRNDLNDVVQFLGMLSSRTLEQVLSDADVLVNFSQNQHIAIPAKTFEYLGSAKEILLIAEHDSDSAAVMREARRGICVEPGDDADMKRALETLYRRYVLDASPPNVDLTASEAFSRKRQNGRYVRILSAALAGGNDARVPAAAIGGSERPESSH